jgi:hypothetical protein
MKVYPNPTSSKLWISQGKQDELEVVLFDNMGKEVSRHLSSQLETEIDMSGLAKGVYFIHVKKQSQVITKRIIKM